MIIKDPLELSRLLDNSFYQPPLNVLLCSPDYFDVVDVKNIYMKDMKGHVDTNFAKQQWEELLIIYNLLQKDGTINEINVIPGESGLEDMVFCANQTFPWKTKEGVLKVILSNMKYPSRQKEVKYFIDFYIKKGYEIVELEKDLTFEGMGDAIPHPEKRILFGGYGFRSENNAYDIISKVLDVPVVLLELKNEKYYHLDTCFLPLNKEMALIAQDAFSDTSIAILKKVFKNLIEVPEAETLNFALNVHCISNPVKKKKAAVIQKENNFTSSILKKVGYKVYELDTSEFIKSGGSVFCMKMMYY